MAKLFVSVFAVFKYAIINLNGTANNNKYIHTNCLYCVLICYENIYWIFSIFYAWDINCDGCIKCWSYFH